MRTNIISQVAAMEYLAKLKPDKYKFRTLLYGTRILFMWENGDYKQLHKIRGRYMGQPVG